MSTLQEVQKTERLFLNEVTLIKIVTAKKFGFFPSDLSCSSRRKDVVRARQVAMYICRAFTCRSLNYIGGKFGGRDHSTVLHAFQKIGGLLKTDPALQAIVAEIKAEVDQAKGRT